MESVERANALIAGLERRMNKYNIAADEAADQIKLFRNSLEQIKEAMKEILPETEKLENKIHSLEVDAAHQSAKINVLQAQVDEDEISTTQFEVLDQFPSETLCDQLKNRVLSTMNLNCTLEEIEIAEEHIAAILRQKGKTYTSLERNIPA